MSLQPGRTICSRWIGRVFSLERKSSSASELPLYLCPAFRSLSTESRARPHIRQTAPTQFRQLKKLHAQAAAAVEIDEAEHHAPIIKQPARTLPGQCSGCGALSQTSLPDQAGYFDVSRKTVRQYLGLEEEKQSRTRDRDQKDEIVRQALSGLNVKDLAKIGIDLTALLPQREIAPSKAQSASDKPPVCDRCHKLIHHSAGTSIFHPSVESLRDTIEESPYKKNHVYHVLDAADFPMSLIKGLPALLDVTLRTQNRRSATSKYHRGRLMEMSFVITRSDLLAAKKEQVDAMMPYIKEVLREALGRLGGRVRLGNVRCVSAKRHWWTKELKEEIYERGGAGWMVGRVNVGKSQLFEAVYPKNRMDPEKSKLNRMPKDLPLCKQELDTTNPILPGLDLDNGSELLPPPQPETQFPAMPIVSSLPGTTASPIRVPFGSGKGELIDLPGLARGDLELHIREACRQDLIMKSRVVPEQQVIKPGQSLLIGGFIRITPRNVAPDEELIFLGYAFTPIEPHLTATDKAVLVQTQSPDAPKIANIALPGTGEKIQHAGAFQLRYDITKQKTGPITSKVAAGIRVDRLPYRVLGIDILIEGCGWVELSVQVRTRKLFGDRKPEKEREKEEETRTLGEWESEWPGVGAEAEKAAVAAIDKLDLRPEPVNSVKKKDKSDDPWAAVDAAVDDNTPEPNWPVIDVFSPEGKFIGYRRPMCAWEINRVKKSKEESKQRPRPSMKGVKKEVKRGHRPI